MNICHAKSVMTNLEKYRKAFCDGLEIKEDMLEGLEYLGIDQWDSVGHMALIAELENEFSILMDADDILDLSSYEKGMEILTKNYNVVFD